MLAFSTCWNMRRHADGMEMIEELLRLGIRNIELGHGLKITQIEGILRVVERGDAQVSSIHNFCPHPIEIPADAPDCFEFTSHRESDRRRAVRLTRQTIEMAAHLDARAVILHGGRARALKVQRRCLQSVEKGEFLTKRFGRMKVAAVRAREAAGPALLARLESAIEELLPLASSLGVRLALENRERYEDVPSERELPGFLNRIASPFLAYWHDFGHAQIKDNFRFLDHRRWLRLASPFLLGCHVHDVQWPATDHQPPFSGEIPFHDLLPLLPPNPLLVFEISPHIPADQVLASWKRWRQLFPE